MRRLPSSGLATKLLVSKLDRLGRNLRAVAEIADDLHTRGIGIVILQFGKDTLDTTGPTGRLMLNVFAAFSQVEREIMLERQAEGIAKAKGEGKCKGPKPRAREKALKIVELFRAQHSVAEIVRQTGVGRGCLLRARSSRTACAGNTRGDSHTSCPRRPARDGFGEIGKRWGQGRAIGTGR